MRKSNYTQGPWIGGSAVSSIVGLGVHAQGGRVICHVNCAADPIHGKMPGDDEFNRVAVANAKLIAAAPDLVDALVQALVHIEADETTHGRNFAAGNVARAALKKAMPE